MRSFQRPSHPLFMLVNMHPILNIQSDDIAVITIDVRIMMMLLFLILCFSYICTYILAHLSRQSAYSIHMHWRPSSLSAHNVQISSMKQLGQSKSNFK